MRPRSAIGAALTVIAVAATACTTTTTQGKPTAAESATGSATTTSPQATATTATSPTPSGPQVGTATMQVTGGGNCTLAAARAAMGIDWMTKGEINESIPPAYTELVGKQLLSHLAVDHHEMAKAGRNA